MYDMQKGDMLKKPMLPLLISLALPILAGSAFQIFYNIVDTVWISLIDKSDPSLVGATGLIFPIIFFVIAISTGLTTGVSSVTARAIGSRSSGILKKIAISGLVMAGVLSVILTVFAYLFLEPIINALGAQGNYFTNSRDYLFYLIPDIGFTLLVSILYGVLQGEGDMKPVMISMMLGTIVNIILDPILIFGAGLGIKGAAIATSFSQLLVLVFLVGLFVTRKTEQVSDWRPGNISIKSMGDITAVALPLSMSQILIAVGLMAFNVILIKIDDVALTAFSFYGRLEGIALIPVIAISSALVAIVGQNAGRGNIDRVNRAWRISNLAAFIVSVGVILVMVVITPFILPLIQDISDVYDMTMLLIRCLSVSIIFGNVVILSQSFFMALGKVFQPVLLTVIRLFVLVIPMIMLHVFVFDHGLYGFILGIIEGSMISAGVALLITQKELQRLMPVDIIAEESI